MSRFKSGDVVTNGVFQVLILKFCYEYEKFEKYTFYCFQNNTIDNDATFSSDEHCSSYSKIPICELFKD